MLTSLFDSIIQRTLHSPFFNTIELWTNLQLSILSKTLSHMTEIKSHGPGPKKHNKNTLCRDLVTTYYFTNAFHSLT